MQVQEIIRRLQGYVEGGTLKPTDEIEVEVQSLQGVDVVPLGRVTFDNFGIALAHPEDAGDGNPARPASVIISVGLPDLTVNGDLILLRKAAETALECFRGIYDELEDQGEDNDVLDKTPYWPLSVLRYALGDQSDKAQAEAFLRGEYEDYPPEDDDDEDEDDDEDSGLKAEDCQAAAEALGREVNEDELNNALAEYGDEATDTLEADLAEKWAHFERLGGRGVELADEIDKLRMVVAVRKLWKM